MMSSLSFPKIIPGLPMMQSEIVAGDGGALLWEEGDSPVIDPQTAYPMRTDFGSFVRGKGFCLD
jgi:hypothetical protein